MVATAANSTDTTPVTAAPAMRSRYETRKSVNVTSSACHVRSVVFPGQSYVFDLGPMYVTDRQTTTAIYRMHLTQDSNTYAR